MAKHDFFISYAHDDRDWAQWIASTLEEAAYRVVLSGWDFRPGANYTAEISRAAGESDRILALLSPEYPQKEVSAVFAKNPAGLAKLLPVRIHPAKREGVFSQISYLDFVGLEEPEALVALLQELRKERGQFAPGGPSFPGSLSARERDFCQLVPWGKSLLSRLREDGASITQLRVIGPNRWVLRSRIPEVLQEAYGTAPEVLFLVVYDEVKGEDLQTARKELLRKELDLDPDLLVIVDDRPRLKERLGRLPLQWGQWVPWSPRESEFPPLAELFREHLPFYDVFEQRDPVRGRQVIGRNAIVSDLGRRVQQEQALGVFGLRKVGKTTVVRAVTDWLDPLSVQPSDREEGRSSILAVWLDCELLAERTFQSLISHFRRELKKRLSLENGSLLPEGDPDDLGALLEAALERIQLPLCVVLDEYDLLFEGSGGGPAIAGIEKLFRIFRAVAQETGRLSLVVIGRDATWFESPLLNGWPNPMLDWLVPFWLGPLPEDGADELLVKLGRRVLLEVGVQTASLARDWTGGHPLLHRQFGSALLEKSRTQKGASREHLATDSFCQDALDLFLSRDAVITICHEVSHLLSSRYPEAEALLVELCYSSPHEVASLVEGRGGWLRSEARLLRNLGLILGDAESLWIPEVFRWYLRTLAPRVQGRRA